MIVSSVKSSSSNNKATRQELANSCFGRVEKITSTLLTPYTPHPGRRRPTPTSTACVWEDFSEYSLSICDEDDTSKVDDEEDTAATLSSTSRLSNYDKSSSSLTSNAIEPRPGSLLELILKEDTPKLSGCNYTQKMRKRRGSLMQERVIDNVNEFELLKLQYGGYRKQGE